MVRILVAPDKFKGSLSADAVCSAVHNALVHELKYQISSQPLADGGEGTFEILTQHFSAQPQDIVVHDPLMRKIPATFGLSADGSTAFMEMAKASGLQLLTNQERNPLRTTTFGTGEMIAEALKKGADKIVLGIGGSATNDAGIGMATALGYQFYDGHRISIFPGCGNDLITINNIERSEINPRLKDVSFTVLCDVANPLTGPNGAAHIFASQKGADQNAVEKLDRGLAHFAEVLMRSFSFDADFEGAGAAGGLGAGSKFFLNARMTRGIDYIAEITDLEKKISACDIVISGEGKLDEQSFSGKVVGHVVSLSRKHGKKNIVICGRTAFNPMQLEALGIDECIELAKGIDQERSMKYATQILQKRLQESQVLMRS